MKKYLTISVLRSILYLVLLFSSIFVLDVIDNKADLKDWQANDSDKALILSKSETYKLYYGDIPLILIFIVVAPVYAIIGIFSGFQYPSHGYFPEDIAYLGVLEIIQKVAVLITYVLLPIVWILYFRKLIKSANTSRFSLKFIFIGTLILGCLASSFFAVRSMFENFKGFF